MRKDCLAFSHGRSGSLAAGSYFVMLQHRRFFLRGQQIPVGVLSSCCVLRGFRGSKYFSQHQPENWISGLRVDVETGHQEEEESLESEIPTVETNLKNPMSRAEQERED